MLNIKNILSFAAVVCGLLIVFAAAPQKASAQIPPGSYLKTCDVVNIDTKFSVLTANCKRKDEGKGTRTNKNFRYKYCIVDTIYNDNGFLHCTINKAARDADEKKANEQAVAEKAQKDAADKAEQDQKDAADKKDAAKAEAEGSKPGFDSAAVIVLGRESKPGEVVKWVGLMKNTPDGAAKVTEGVKFNDAIAFLKQYISKSEGAAARAELIDNAFREVYGRRTTPAEQAFWDSEVKAQKTWYAPMVIAEIGKLNANAENRVIPIQLVYFLTFGRDPSKDELNYWKARKEHFRMMTEANRNWLYTSDGAKDRQETVRRALKINNNGKAPTDDEMKQKLTEFTPNKTIYVEMTGKKISDFQ